MINEQQISKTIENLYEAALRPDMWQTALLSLGETFGSYGGSVMFWDYNNNTVPKLYSTIIPDEKAQIEYIQHYGSLDPRALYLLDNPDATFFSDRQIISNEITSQHEYRHWENTKTEMRYAYGSRLVVSNGICTVLSMARNNDEGHPDTDEEYIFRKFIPHVKRSIQLSELFELQKLEKDALFLASERNQHAVITLDQYGDVLHLNSAANRIIAKGDCIALYGRYLSLLNMQDKTRFEALIKDALQKNILASTAGGRMALTRKDDKLPYQVLVSPLPKNEVFMAARRPTLMVVLSDPSHCLPSAKQLHHMFRLTPREAELAVFLMSGEDLAASAKRMKISRHTLQSFLKSMFLKTQTHSLTTMVALFMKSLPGINMQND